jgi:hypothetical protein
MRPRIKENTFVIKIEKVVFNAKIGKQAETALKFSIKEADIRLMGLHIIKL